MPWQQLRAAARNLYARRDLPASGHQAYAKVALGVGLVLLLALVWQSSGRPPVVVQQPVQQQQYVSSLNLNADVGKLVGQVSPAAKASATAARLQPARVLENQLAAYSRMLMTQPARMSRGCAHPRPAGARDPSRQLACMRLV